MALQNLSLTPEQLEVGLNEVFYPETEMQGTPGLATSADVFKIESANKRTETDLKVEGLGYFNETGEANDIASETSEELGTVNYTAKKYSNGFKITYEALADEQYSHLRELASQLGRNAMVTREKDRFEVLRDAFNGNTYVGPDGKALCATDHPDSVGGTISNKETSVLSESSLETLFNKAFEAVDEKGVALVSQPDILLVPTQLYQEAMVITKSELRSGTANNDLNYYSTVFPGLRVLHTPFMGSKYGGSDSQYFLIDSKLARLKVFERDPLQTWIIDWTNTNNMVSAFNAFYRESVGFSDFHGVFGSDGTV